MSSGMRRKATSSALKIYQVEEPKETSPSPRKKARPKSKKRKAKKSK